MSQLVRIPDGMRYMDMLEDRIAALERQAAGQILLATALPTSPTDGQEILFLADATNGILWHLRYRVASASAYQWEYIGGPPLYVGPAATGTAGGFTTPTPVPNLAAIVVPLSGDYMVDAGSGMVGNNGTIASAFDIFHSVYIAGVGGAQAFVTPTAGFGGASARLTERRNGVAAGSTAQLYWWSNFTTSNMRIQASYLSIYPARVG